MTKSRRIFLASGVTTMIGLSTGCVTSAMLRAPKKTESSYKEEVVSILISHDKKNIVFIGNDFHYIFDAPSQIVNTVGSEFQEYVKASFYSFRVKNSGDIAGNVRLSLEKTVPVEYRNKALEAGYKRSDITPESEYDAFYLARLKGTRYLANGVTPGVSQTLNNKYTVIVHTEENNSVNPVNYLLTPITVAIDGILILAGLPLFLLLVARCSENGVKCG